MIAKLFSQFTKINLASEAKQYQQWWSYLSFFKKWGLLLGVLGYLFILHLLNGLRSDHFFVCCALMSLYYLGPRFRPVLNFALPFILTGIVYDSQRFYSDYIRGPIHVSEPYHFDLRYFGIHTDQGILTPNEWWQKHTYPFLDFITGFYYLFFIAMYALTIAYFYFIRPYQEALGEKRNQLLFYRRRMTWAFFIVNVIGYTTYYWYAAAPPWYVASYGLGPADLSVHASSAGAVRFDQLLGTHFFSEMYGRAADVFGAVPSLHVAYPFLAFYYSLKLKRLRVFSLVFYLMMCFSAVYLNHHYMLDILVGTLYAIIVAFGLDAVLKQKKLEKAVVMSVILFIGLLNISDKAYAEGFDFKQTDAVIKQGYNEWVQEVVYKTNLIFISVKKTLKCDQVERKLLGYPQTQFDLAVAGTPLDVSKWESSLSPWTEKEMDSLNSCKKNPCKIKLNDSEVSQLSQASAENKKNAFIKILSDRLNAYRNANARYGYEYPGEILDPWRLLSQHGIDLHATSTAQLLYRLLDMHSSRIEPLRQLLDVRKRSFKLQPTENVTVVYLRDFYSEHYFDSWSEYHELHCKKDNRGWIKQIIIADFDLMKDTDLISIISRGEMKSGFFTQSAKYLNSITTTVD